VLANPVQVGFGVELGQEVTVSVTTLTPSRALRPPRRIDWRAIGGIILLLVATGGSIGFWSATSDTRTVVIASRDLPAGARPTAADFAVARVRVDDAIYQAAIPANELASLVGQQLGEPVHAQEILARAEFSPRPALGPNQVALTIAISPETAVGGRILPGDTVAILLTANKGKPDEQTTVVLPRATVYDVGYDQQTAVVNAESAGQASTPGSVRWLTLALSVPDAIKTTQAKYAGEIDVALVPPQPPNGSGQP
jgi:Flp pilus assembly protein CpaB